MAKALSVMLILLIFLVCCTNSATKKIVVEGSSKVNTVEPLQSRQGKEVIRNTSGVVVLNNGYSKNDFVRIYNADGSLWYKFTFYNNEAFKYTNKDFKPFAFHPDYFLLVLKCPERSENRFEVVVNEETGMKKYVKADDPALRFETWNELILNTFAVDFNRKENPVLETPGGQVKSSDIPKEITFHPIEIKGEWLKIRWNSTEQIANSKTSDDFGWIKWKDDVAILIELFYFS